MAFDRVVVTRGRIRRRYAGGSTGSVRRAPGTFPYTVAAEEDPVARHAPSSHVRLVESHQVTTPDRVQGSLGRPLAVRGLVVTG